MRRWTEVILLAAVGLAALCQSGCTFFACSGGGPLQRRELRDWAGLRPWPEPAELWVRNKVKSLKAIRLPSFGVFRGQYAYREGPFVLSTAIPDPWDVPFAPVPGYVVKGTFSFWLRLIPSSRPGHWVYYVPDQPKAREFYVAERAEGWGFLVGDFLFSSTRAEAFSVDTRERVASQQLDARFLWGLGWSRLRRVEPVAPDGTAGLHALADPSLELDEVRYSLKDGSTLFLGLIGWGRVNRRYYLQVLWVPIPIAKADE